MRYSIAGHDIHKLLTSDWHTPRGGIYVREDLTVHEAEQSGFFRNVRTMVNALNESGGTRATEAGNLNRKFVGTMLEQLCIRPDIAETIRAVNQVINEQDVWDLHQTRVISELAGLIRKYRGMFKPIQKRSHLMEDENAGALYNLLFLTFFRKFNLAYLDRMNEAPLVQNTIAVSLFMLSIVTEQWVSVEDVPAFIFPVRVKEQILEGSSFDFSSLVAYTRIMRPLVHFGLLEERRMGYRAREAEVRKTDLFDRVLKFDVEMTSVPGYLH